MYSVQLHELAYLYKQFLNISIEILWFLTNCLQNSFQKKKKMLKMRKEHRKSLNRPASQIRPIICAFERKRRRTIKD